MYQCKERGKMGESRLQKKRERKWFIKIIARESAIRGRLFGLLLVCKNLEEVQGKFFLCFKCVKECLVRDTSRHTEGV